MRGAICKRFSANAPPGALRIFVLISVVLRGRVLVFGARERSELVTRRLSRLVSVAAVLVSRQAHVPSSLPIRTYTLPIQTHTFPILSYTKFIT